MLLGFLPQWSSATTTTVLYVHHISMGPALITFDFFVIIMKYRRLRLFYFSKIKWNKMSIYMFYVNIT